MSNALARAAALDELAQHLYDFLPGSRMPQADQSLTFGGVAAEVGVSQFWTGGSKQPAIRHLLEGVLNSGTGRFSKLIIKIVERSITYRKRKDPLTRAEIERLNELLLKVGFKIPELHDPAFLGTFADTGPPKQQHHTQRSPADPAAIADLHRRFMALTTLSPQDRGRAFEPFLSDLFALYKLAPRGAFRLTGEQIDGSFQLDNDVYLLEAKWENGPTGEGELLVFHGKVDGKAQWARGLFISIAGFTAPGLQQFAQGRRTSIICMDGLDLALILSGRIHLVEALERKARRAAESGAAFVPIRELFPGVI